MRGGTGEEAFRSKRRYIKDRILDWDEAALVALAHTVQSEYGDEDLVDAIDARASAAHPPVSELTRRAILKTLNALDTLFGDLDLFDGLRIICTDRLDPRDGDRDLLGLPTFRGHIQQHYLRNPDWSNEQLLIECGALTVPQRRFFKLLEKLLDPVVRQGDVQRALADGFNGLLAADGYRAVVNGSQSRHPVYAIEHIPAGVSGRPKNLIFAAVHSKPDLYFTDAINNDIGIRNASDALIYDDFIHASGVSWHALAQWWQTQERLDNLIEAKRSLYARLAQSVRAAKSPGQYALFSTFYREFPSRLDEALPALIPEVYLHYDPRTLRERGADPVLLRQRMDFLLLLDQNVRVVIEVDGSQHYSEGNRAAPAKYASMVEEDRRLRLAGYEIYRFGAAEFLDTGSSGDGKFNVGPHSRQRVVDFFTRLWQRYPISGAGPGTLRGS